jgi:protein-S-isoprenylcysteine O-methyltransferase Ste14
MSLVLRNLLFTLGEAWLFGSAALLLYAAALAIGFHLLLVAYEEPKLRATFGDAYQRYRRAVPRWVPRRPRPSS